MLRAAVFDMDGLMFDSERLVYENWQKMMDEQGYQYSIEDFRMTVGKRKNEVQHFYFNKYGSDFPYWEFSERGKKMYVDYIHQNGIPVKKGLYEVLTYLKDNNFKIALATSTSRQTSVMNLKSAGVLKYFDVLVCGDDVKNGKPHPEVFLTAAQRLSQAAKDCVAFEDSINGIKSAFAAGMVTVMVPDFLQPTNEIMPMINCLCRDLNESIEFIKNIDGQYPKCYNNTKYSLI